MSNTEHYQAVPCLPEGRPSDEAVPPPTPPSAAGAVNTSGPYGQISEVYSDLSRKLYQFSDLIPWENPTNTHSFSQEGLSPGSPPQAVISSAAAAAAAAAAGAVPAGMRPALITSQSSLQPAQPSTSLLTQVRNSFVFTLTISMFLDQLRFPLMVTVFPRHQLAFPLR